VITKHGHPAAVVVAMEDLESLEETLDVMGSAALLDDIREALAELESVTHSSSGSTGCTVPAAATTG
jgi:PHD/YefM family antitoxin component YafN of YafNO toxin-antitoxin module